MYAKSLALGLGAVSTSAGPARSDAPKRAQTPRTAPGKGVDKACEIPPDLARLAELWPSLPEATRAAILTLAEGRGVSSGRGVATATRLHPRAGGPHGSSLMSDDPAFPSRKGASMKVGRSGAPHRDAPGVADLAGPLRADPPGGRFGGCLCVHVAQESAEHQKTPIPRTWTAWRATCGWAGSSDTT